MDDEQKAVQRRTRWLMVAFILACLCVIGMSLWIRTGHTMTMPLAVGIPGLMLFAVVVIRIATKERMRIDPQFSARVTASNSGFYSRYVHWRGTLSAMALAAILLMFAFFKLAQAVPALAGALRQLFGPLTVKELLLGAFGVCFALVWGVVELYTRYSQAKR